MNWELLHKYLSGECNSEEKIQVEEWLEGDKENQRFFDSLSRIWDVTPKDEIRIDPKSAWRSFQHKITDEKKLESQERNSPSGINYEALNSGTHKRKRKWRWIPVSVMAAAIFLLGFFAYSFWDSAPATNKQAKSVHKIVTQKGQRTIFRLPDGTRIHVNAESSVEIPPSYGDSLRHIRLSGEAFFDVIHNAEKPFIVKSDNSITRVLGTKFGVKAYPGDRQVQVVVEEGKVALRSSQISNAEALHITRNKLGVLPDKGESKLFKISKTEHYLGWKDGRLIFDSTPVKEVATQLERWYDIEIFFEENLSLKSKTMTASFKDEPMNEVLKILALSLDAKFKRVERKIIFAKMES